MKLRFSLITLSIVLNVALLAAFALRPAATTALFRDAFQPGHHAENSPAGKPSTADATRAATAAAHGTASATGWPEFESGDFAGLVTRLRAAGFPPSIVRAIVFATVNEHFAARRRELQPRPAIATEYWKNPRPNQVFDPKMQGAMRELNREQNALVKELLGPDYNRPPITDEWYVADQRRRFGDLPTTKVEHLQKITTDYNELNSKVHEDAMGILLPEDRAKLALLQREQRADIERLFTPEELENYDLRNSRAANNVRNRLGRFEATEEEFRALYAAQKTLTDQDTAAEFGPFGPPSPEAIRQRTAAQQALETQLKTVLGEQRYAEFQSANAPGRQNGNEEMVGRLVTRLNLPPATTATVLSVQSDIQQRAAALQTNRTLPPEQRTAQLTALQAEAATRLTDTLGATGLEAYKQYGGQWLQQLTPPASRPGVGVPLRQ